MQITHSFKSIKSFYDDNNFPQGFSRSGHFTIVEAQLLTTIGHRLFQLESGSVSPETEEEVRFVNFIETNRDPENQAEKLWKKYKLLITKKAFHTLHGRNKATSITDNEESY